MAEGKGRGIGEIKISPARAGLKSGVTVKV